MIHEFRYVISNYDDELIKLENYQLPDDEIITIG